MLPSSVNIDFVCHRRQHREAIFALCERRQTHKRCSMSLPSPTQCQTLDGTRPQRVQAQLYSMVSIPRLPIILTGWEFERDTLPCSHLE